MEQLCTGISDQTYANHAQIHIFIQFFSSNILSRNSFTTAFILNVLQNEFLKALKFENSNKLYTLAYISINENHFQNPYPALLY